MALREEQLEDLIDRAWEATTPGARAKAARAALCLDHEAIDAYVALALTVPTLAEQVALLREAVRIGAKLWAAEIKRPSAAHFWLDVETRPYMRAVHNLALALWEQGDRDEAVSLVEHLIRINPNDNQGARYLCLAWHPVLGNWSRLERVLTRYRDEWSTDYFYSRCLDAFRRGDPSDEWLLQALRENPHVPGFLLGQTSRLPMAAAVAVGSPEEASSYCELHLDAWKAVPGALRWLRKTMKRLSAGSPPSVSPVSP